MSTAATDPRPTILPTGSTALERAVDQSAPRWDALLGLAGDGPIGLPASFTPWLAAEWGLDGFAAYFAHDPRALITAGLPWLRQRGTPAAVRSALRWLGYTHVTILDDGPWLHIDPGRLIDAPELRLIAHVVRASIPAHVRFYRVFHGLDGRVMRFDGGPHADGGLYDTDTGAPIDVDPWGDPVKLSQGRVSVRGTNGPAHAALRRCPLAHATRLMRRSDVPRYDGWRFDAGGTHGPRRAGHALRLRLAPAYQRPAALPPAASGLRISGLAVPLAGPPLRHATITALHTCDPILMPPRTWSGRWDSKPWRHTVAHKLTQEP